MANSSRRGERRVGPGEFDAPHSLAMGFKRAALRRRPLEQPHPNFQPDENPRGVEQFGRPSGVFIDKKTSSTWPTRHPMKQTNPSYKQGIRIGSVTDGKVKPSFRWSETNALEGVGGGRRGKRLRGLHQHDEFRRFVKK